MQIRFSCPRCERTIQNEIAPGAEVVECRECSWSRPVPRDDWRQSRPQRCLVCGCDDLWRQKDFPQALGLALVGLGALLSTIAVAYYYPTTALGVLLAFALADLALYAWMPDVLVCYRCHARHRHAQPGEEFPRFNLETSERYRQESARLTKSMES